MKKYLLAIFLMTFCIMLSAEDLVLKNGRKLPGFCGIGQVAPVPRTNLKKWGVIVFYTDGKDDKMKRTVVEPKDFPNDFKYMGIVRRRWDMLPKVQAEYAARKKALLAEEKAEKAQQKKLQAMAKKKDPFAPKLSKPTKTVKLKSKDFKKSSD